MLASFQSGDGLGEKGEMEIVVCIKQVPETTDVSWDQKTGALIREEVSGILNPNDKNALEAALTLREEHGGLITALSMGPLQAEECLREALSMGADKAILLSDRKFAGADTWATSYTISLALKRIGRFDLILFGKESADGMTGHVGPQVAEFLDLPQLTYAGEIEIDGDSVRIKQKMEDSYRILESPMPAIVTAERNINEPRIPPMDAIIRAYNEQEVLLWASEELGGDQRYFGLLGSPTQSRRVYTHVVEKGKVKFLEGEAKEIAEKLVEVLIQKNLI